MSWWKRILTKMEKTKARVDSLRCAVHREDWDGQLITVENSAGLRIPDWFERRTEVRAFEPGGYKFGECRYFDFCFVCDKCRYSNFRDKSKTASFGFFDVPESAVSDFVARVYSSWGMDWDFIAKELFSGPWFLRRDSASDAWWIIPVRWTMSMSSSDSIKRHRASFPVASVIVRIHRKSSCSGQIVKQDPSREGSRDVTFHTTARYSLFVLAVFALLLPKWVASIQQEGFFGFPVLYEGHHDFRFARIDEKCVPSFTSR